MKSLIIMTTIVLITFLGSTSIMLHEENNIEEIIKPCEYNGGQHLTDMCRYTEYPHKGLHGISALLFIVSGLAMLPIGVFWWYEFAKDE